VFVFLAARPGALPKRVLTAIDDAERRVLSVASVWEMTVKSSNGRLKLPLEVNEWVRTRAARLSVDIEPVSLEHTAAVERLPLRHRDPFDRLLIGVANVEGYTLVTADRRLKDYRVHIMAAWGSR
jgi:PIN domain nuclease of toxin-antitoxin system